MALWDNSFRIRIPYDQQTKHFTLQLINVSSNGPTGENEQAMQPNNFNYLYTENLKLEHNFTIIEKANLTGPWRNVGRVAILPILR